MEGVHPTGFLRVTGVLEEDGTLRMWVNLRCAGSPAPRARAGAALAGGLLLGAAALQEAPLAADFLDGRITSAGVAVLAPYVPDGALEN